VKVLILGVLLFVFQGNEFSSSDRAVVQRCDAVECFLLDYNDRVLPTPPNAKKHEETAPSPKEATQEVPKETSKKDKLPEKPATSENAGQGSPQTKDPVKSEQQVQAPADEEKSERFRGIKIVKSFKLSEAQVADVVANLERSMSKEVDPAKCFIPNIGLRFRRGEEQLELLLDPKCGHLHLFKGDQRTIYTLAEDFGKFFSQSIDPLEKKEEKKEDRK